MVFHLSLENPLSCVFHGKERVIPVGFLTIVNVIVQVFTLLHPCKACRTSPNKTAIHFFNKSCIRVLGPVNWQLIYCLENYSLLIYIHGDNCKSIMSLIREKMLKLVSFLFRQAIPSRGIHLVPPGDIYILLNYEFQ